MSRTRWTTAAGLATAAVLLSGCGTTPGVAVSVGDHEISHDRIDEATSHLCDALGEQFESQGNVVPMAVVRQAVVRLLTLRSQATQIADAYGIEPGSTYADDVEQRRRSVASEPEEVREDYVLLTSSTALANDVAERVGMIELEGQGIEEPTREQVGQAGVEVFNTWPDANGLEVDPRYGLENVDGQLEPVDTNLSVAVSDTARSGLEEQPSVAFASSLPANQRCG